MQFFVPRASQMNILLVALQTHIQFGEKTEFTQDIYYSKLEHLTVKIEGKP